jgi:hypothetical protein
MAKIALSEPEGPYGMLIDTEVMSVLITEAFLGVRFETVDGECLSISMRDSGYELIYETNGAQRHIELKGGVANFIS